MFVAMTTDPTDETYAPLLNTLAQSLDIREVFGQISALAVQTVPHDRLVFGLITEDRTHFRAIALSDESQASLSEVPLSLMSRQLLEEEFDLFHHIGTVPGKSPRFRGLVRIASAGADTPHELELADPAWARMMKGIQSWMRLSVRLKGGVVGGLLFLSRAPDQYSVAAVPPARRIADLLALAFAHERLAEEERRRALAQERALRLEARVVRLTGELEAAHGHGVIGASKSWRDVLSQAAKVAPAETTVLLTGESGTGKEVIARLIHRGSRRAEGPFMALNCAALSETLLESELFGYERGAFTGAVTARVGQLEQAAGGTLFLDEVGEMSAAVQAKLLRVLEEREFHRLGGTGTLRADVRVIAATNRDLKAAMAGGAFREDLYYRLRVFAIHLPPLRERKEDMMPLFEHFVRVLGAAVTGRAAAGISREVRQQVLSYEWPGNVRELRNAVERALILCEGGLINPEHLPWRGEFTKSPIKPLPDSSGVQPTPVDFPPDGVDLEAIERSFIEGALRQTGHNKSKAAKLLGLSRTKLYSRMNRFGL